MSHTPGPWAICGYVVYDVPTGFSVTKLSQEHPTQTNSNAQLIAAAPELLDALESLYGAIDSCVDLTPEVLMQARLAIKKARGEQ